MVKKVAKNSIKKPAVKRKMSKRTVKETRKSKKLKIKRLPAKDLNSFKKNILKLRDDLIEQIKDISENTLMKSQKDISGDISGYSLHMADMASDNYERDFNLNLVSSERRTLLEIENALKRIEDKTYGVCSSCNKFIAKSRLKAIPYARYCTKCKNKLEQENML